MISALDIHVTGIVQGVGFRPFVYRLARRYVINGWVLNSADGVHIHAEGEDNNLDAFCLAIANEAPPAASVEQVEMHEIPLENFSSFDIRFSCDENMGGANGSAAGENRGRDFDGTSDAAGDVAAGNMTSGEKTLVSADLATCVDCAHELFDPADRRYRYPFINCTNCGPRFTIIGDLPYDRDKTSMRPFEMCSRCADEYSDPLDRRFHAQPDACFECGPHITWREKFYGDCGVAEFASAPDFEVKNLDVSKNFSDIKVGKTREKSDEIFASAVSLLRAGGIVAIKGLGGFHLACDACNAEAVQRLRKLKQRSNKAFAIMARSLDDVCEIAQIDPTEKKLLTGCERPIVLLKKRDKPSGSLSQQARGTLCDKPSGNVSHQVQGSLGGKQSSIRSDKLADGLSRHKQALADEVTMGLPEIGVMLPYTPVQHILLHDFCEAGGHFLVMTSGNLYDNPICVDDEEAAGKLGGIADAILGNDREILTRYDDSVVRVIDAAGTPAVQMIRRARGYAPVPIKLECGEGKFLQNKPIAQQTARESQEAALDNQHAKAENELLTNSDSNTKNAGTHVADNSVIAEIFAAGPEQKNTCSFLRPTAGSPGSGSSSAAGAAHTSRATLATRAAEIFVSQHIGDLENAEVMDAWNAARTRMQALFEFAPAVAAFDPHPEYLSTKWVEENSAGASGLEGSELDCASGTTKEEGQNAVGFLQTIAVQHHFAHIASVMAENNLAGPVAGFAFDGTGYGADKNVWGGEVMLCNNRDFERFANFCYMPMPGVAACVKNPAQMAVGVLWGCDLLEHPYVEELAKCDKNGNLSHQGRSPLGKKQALSRCDKLQFLSRQNIENLCKIIESGTNVAYTSSVGRLFDAAAALTGICPSSTYEGEAAIMLEAELQKLATSDGHCKHCSSSDRVDSTSQDKNNEWGGDPDKGKSISAATMVERKNLYNPDPRYSIAITKNSATEGSTAHDTSVLLLDPAPTFKALLDDLQTQEIAKAQMSLNFHNAFVECIVTCAKLINQMYGIRMVALSGGCFMNRYLMETAITELTKTGFTVAINREVPCNDGGISLGQATVVANLTSAIN